MVVNMHEAKSQLSRLVEQAMAGEDVVIARAGRPVARLVPYVEARHTRVPGRWKGQVWVAPDFDDIDEELADLFYGGQSAPT